MDQQKMEQETGAVEERAPTPDEETDFLTGFDEVDAPAQDDDTDAPPAETPPEAPPEGGEATEDAPAGDPQAETPEDPPPEDPPAETQPAAEETAKLTRYVDAMEGQCRDMYTRVQMYEPIDRLAALQGIQPEEMVKQLADGFERAMIDGLCNDRGLDEKTAAEFVALQKEKAGQGYKPYQPKGIPGKMSFDKAYAELCAMAPEAKDFKELPEGVAAYLKEGNPLPLAWFRHQAAALGKELAETKQKLAVAKQNAHNQKAAPRPVSGVPASAQGDAFLLGFNEDY